MIVKSKINLALIFVIIALSILLLICITYLQKRRATRDRQEPVPQEVLSTIEKEKMYSSAKLQRRIDALEKEMERLKHDAPVKSPFYRQLRIIVSS